MSNKKITAASRSVGTKPTQKKASSTPGPKKTSSTRSSTQRTKASQSKSTIQTLEKNLEKLTTQSTKPQKKSSKTSTLQESSPKTTPAKQRRKTGTNSGHNHEIKSVRSFDDSLFPHSSFPYRLEDKKENKTCWFQHFSHAEKYINRYHMTSKEYKLWHSQHLLKNH